MPLKPYSANWSICIHSLLSRKNEKRRPFPVFSSFTFQIIFHIFWKKSGDILTRLSAENRSRVVPNYSPFGRYGHCRSLIRTLSTCFARQRSWRAGFQG